LQVAQEWLTRAEHDLQGARTLLSAPTALPEISAYLAQQAAEKSMKAFLTAWSEEFTFTHDLVKLQAKCEALEPAFASLLSAAQTLTPYATEFRYPPGRTAPTYSEAEEATQLGQSILSFVRGHL